MTPLMFCFHGDYFILLEACVSLARDLGGVQKVVSHILIVTGGYIDLMHKYITLEGRP